MKKIIEIGLIKGRHEMPVNRYLFDNIDNVLDFNSIESHIMAFIARECEVSIKNYAPTCNGYDYSEAFTGGVNLVVYVTGLTPVTAALIKCCATNGVNLTLMHYDRETNSYVPQIIFNIF